MSAHAPEPNSRDEIPCRSANTLDRFSMNLRHRALVRERALLGTAKTPEKVAQAANLDRQIHASLLRRRVKV